MKRPHLDVHEEFLKHCLDQRADINGHVLEFGVWSGRTINHIARHIRPFPVHGFDSFEGLPEQWVKGANYRVPAGHFAVDALPKTRSNVFLHKGWIKDTLPRWLSSHQGTASLVHVDVDVYSSTKEILTLMNDRLIGGTVIVFDELWGYDNFRVHEWKALREWVREYQRKIEFIATSWDERAAIRVLK